MKNENISSSYEYTDSSHIELHYELLPKLDKILDNIENNLTKSKRIFDLGCGNGSIANYLTNKGWDITGVDPSEEGIKQANMSYSNIKLYKGSTGENLADRHGKFPILISLVHVGLESPCLLRSAKPDLPAQKFSRCVVYK